MVPRLPEIRAEVEGDANIVADEATSTRPGEVRNPQPTSARHERFSRETVSDEREEVTPLHPNMRNRYRSQRWSNFRRRVAYAPENVYRHRTHGWEYVPVHPFADEPEILSRLDMQPEDCFSVDAWWGIDRDATLLESWVVGWTHRPAGLYARASLKMDDRVHLTAILDAPFVTRTAFEAAMLRFAEAGFPRGRRFRLRWGAPWLKLPG